MDHNLARENAPITLAAFPLFLSRHSDWSAVSPPVYSAPPEPFPENPEEALALDPLPPWVAGRKVIISQKSRPATTSGDGGGLHAWYLTFKNEVC